MKKLKIAIIASTLVLSTSANSALLGRLALTEGGTDYQAYYDDVADLTWLADANYAQTSGFVDDASMTWHVAMYWVTGLNVGGVDGWRLPDTIDVGNDGATYFSIYNGVDRGYNVTTHSELSNMFFNVLGNTAYYDTSGALQSGGGLSNTGPFSNLYSRFYWSATEYAPVTDRAWYFNMSNGYQGDTIKNSYKLAWAVRDGDVSAVPVPAAVWLFGTGLIGLVGFARRKKAYNLN